MKKTSAATLITVVWLALGVVAIVLKFESTKSMSLNEAGDFLAGFFSPVAFLWLVVGYFQQGEELKLNTKALELQVNELQQSVAQQKELVEVTRADMAITKMAYELETQREIRKAQPILQLHANSYNNSNGMISALEASILNEGHSCTSVLLSCAEGDLSQTELAVMPNKSTKIIKYKFQPAVSSFSTSISYLDGIGIKRNIVIEAVKNESGKLIFLPAKDLILDQA